ncbi:hypothetical protein KDW54_07010 [Burkholderia ambifaria]|uniref:hypothetical protein n=1 Tax=Burkholderia ambifaria TaxID=152480 RepID=UPI001B9E40A4|nr:hypothetical protein [Burkholderia ambifaria]MBR8182145.1 hypothetical protein [Burkholderia ambifaria]
MDISKLRRAYEEARNGGDKKAMDLIAQAISYATSGYAEYAWPVYNQYVKEAA